MKVHEILPVKRTFYLTPEEGDERLGVIKVFLHYDAPILKIETMMGVFYINLTTKYVEKDPAKVILDFSKEDLLNRMGIEQIYKPDISYSKTVKNIMEKCQDLSIERFNITSNVYDKMMQKYKCYSDDNCFNALLDMIHEDPILSQYENEIVEKVYIWPEFHSYIADCIIKYLYPVFKTLPTIPKTSFVIEHATPD